MKEKQNYVNEADLKEDVRILYETGEFPERLAKNLQEMVEHILTCRKFNGYTQDWKDEMKGDALLALISTLKAKKYDSTRPNTKVFSWASKVIFNQFYYWLDKKRRKMRQESKIVQDMITCGNTTTKEEME